MKTLLCLLLTFVIGTVHAQKQYYVAVNPNDCSNCLAAGSILKSYDFYEKIQFVLPGTAKRTGKKIIAELMQVPIADSRILASDSLYGVLNQQGPSTLIVEENGHTVFTAQLVALADQEVERALLGKFKPIQRHQLLPDSQVFSPLSRIYCGQSKAWIFDPRFEQIVEFSYVHPERHIEFQPRKWSFLSPYRRIHGDTSGFAKMKALMPILHRIGKDKLEVISVYPDHDTLYATILFREAQQVIADGHSNINVFARSFLVRFTGGKPIQWRYLAGADSTDLALGFPRAIQKINKTKWLFPVIPFEGDQASISPFLAWGNDNGQEICWAGSQKARLPQFFSARKMGSNYTDYFVKYPYLVFKYTNRILSLEQGTSKEAVVGFSDARNDFTNLAQPNIDYEVEDMNYLHGHVALLIKQGNTYYFSLLDENQRQLWNVKLPIPSSKTAHWTLHENGDLYGFDSENNQLLTFALLN